MSNQILKSETIISNIDEETKLLTISESIENNNSYYILDMVDTLEPMLYNMKISNVEENTALKFKLFINKELKFKNCYLGENIKANKILIDNSTLDTLDAEETIDFFTYEFTIINRNNTITVLARKQI